LAKTEDAPPSTGHPLSGVRRIPRATILLIEPDDAVRAALVAALSTNFNVADANSAIAAAELLGGIARPDLAICSVQLPDIDGCSFAMRIRHHTDFAKMPWVFLTREKDANEMMRAMGAGARRCIEKPVKVEQLVKQVTALLAY
jgi:DNA-binding response OmpR family regulator